MADSLQSNDKLLHYAARCGLSCTFPGQRVTLDDVPFRQIEDDPESFCFIQLGGSGLAYLFASDHPMRRDLCHFTEPAYGATDNPGTLCEPILALCRAPDCEVFMATSHSQQAERGAVRAQYVVSRIRNSTE